MAESPHDAGGEPEQPAPAAERAGQGPARRGDRRAPRGGAAATPSAPPSLPQDLALSLAGAAFGGRMVARLEGRVVFVQGGLPGETVRAGLTTARKNFAEAVATAVLAPLDAARATPPCPYFGENGHRRGALPSSPTADTAGGVCGGCQYQHAAYAAQLTYKRQIVADLLRRVGHLPAVAVGETLPSPSPWAYRTKARWSVDPGGYVSYRRADSHDPVPVASCAIVAPPLADVLRRLATPEIAGLLRGHVAEITARCAQDAADPALWRVLLILHPQPGLPDEDAPAASGVDEGARPPASGHRPPAGGDGAAQDPGPGSQHAGGVDLFQALPPPHPLAGLGAALGEACGLWGVAVAPASPGGEALTLWGEDAVETVFAGLRYRLSPLTFFQVNPAAAAALLGEVVAGLNPLRGQTILDLYCGAGAFSLPIARDAAEVFAVEHDRVAVDDAIASAALNGTRNLHVLRGDVEVTLREMAAGFVDAAVLDPPRGGCSRGVLAELGRLALRRLVYVSCDPATLARDLALLGQFGYRTRGVRPVDLFPQTASIEAVAVLDGAS